MDRSKLRSLLIEANSGLTAFMKLLRQLAILDRRIRGHMGRYVECVDSSFPRDLWDEMILDTETFYTVAHDALKLAELFLPTTVLKSFRNDQAYKIMCRIRSQLVRHAYDKPDGDPSGASGFDARYGPVLKSGRQFHDAGYVPNEAAFWQMLKRHGILKENPFGPEPVVSDTFGRRITGRETVKG